MIRDFFKKKLSVFQLDRPDIQSLLERGLTEHQSGHLDQAEALYRQVLDLASNNSQALHLSGVIDYQRDLCDSALVKIEKAINLENTNPEFYNSKGLVLLDLDRAEEALAAFRQALIIKPAEIEISLNVGNALVRLGHIEEAIDIYLKIIELQPGHALAYLNLGNLYLQTAVYRDAVVCYKKALESNPEFIDLYPLLGHSLYQLENYPEAITVLENALKKLTDKPEVYNELGNCYLALDRHEEAIINYEHALRIDTDYVSAIKNIGVACQELGNNDKAKEKYLQVLKIDPTFAEAYHYLSVISVDSCSTDKIQQLLNDKETPDKNRMHCHFALGNCYSALHDYQKSFEHYLQANEAKRATIHYDARQNSDYITRIINTFSPNLINRFARDRFTTEIPVFIVGMPRSGTTLVEQIVSSHSRVYGAGELTALARIELKLEEMLEGKGKYPDSLALVDQKKFHELADDYLACLPAMPSDTQRMTDKLPGNFLRVGLIKLLFPNARIIHCIRNPLDTCVSIFTNYFADGYKYAYELEELGKYYLDYERLMSHWNSLFQKSIFQVRYEDLIASQEQISQELIAYLGLDWEPQCLDFHKNKRAVKTASNVQVRKPLYRQSVNKWKCYAEELQPLIQILEKGNPGLTAES